MESTRAKDVVTYTALAAIVFGVGLFLFTLDMRTAGAPAEQIFLADVATYILAAVAVITGIPAIAMRLSAARSRDADY